MAPCLCFGTVTFSDAITADACVPASTCSPVHLCVVLPPRVVSGRQSGELVVRQQVSVEVAAAQVKAYLITPPPAQPPAPPASPHTVNSPSGTCVCVLELEPPASPTQPHPPPGHGAAPVGQAGGGGEGKGGPAVGPDAGPPGCVGWDGCRGVMV